MNQKGEITIYIGPMFAGKSSELIRQINRWKQLNWNVLAINHISDSRYNTNNIVSHNLEESPSKSLEFLMPLITENDMEYQNAQVIIIDEGQFFTDLYQFVKTSANKYGKKVYLSGLDGDYSKKPFHGSQILALIPEAENVHKLKALCQKCGDGTVASFTSYHTNGLIKKPDDNNQHIPVIGGNKIFQSLCRFHYNQINPEYM
jgi:thymidine kinase